MQMQSICIYTKNNTGERNMRNRNICAEILKNKHSKQADLSGNTHKKKKFSTALTALVISLVLSSCSSGGVKNDDGKITVYTSFFVMYDFASKIGGEKVNVINMVPSGMEPHDWEPSPKDIAGLAEADLFIYSGAGMEGWVEKVLDAVSNKNLIAVETSKGIALQESAHSHGHGEEETEDGHPEDGYDPHVWLNPMNAKIQMKAIKDALVLADAENSDYYEKNYNYYAEKLDELDRKFKEAAKGFSRKEIVVSHAAYGYLCNAYGLEQFALENVTGNSEPTAAKMKEIIDFIRAHDIKVIFYDSLSSSKVVDAVARETGIRTAVLSAIEGLTEEDLKAGKDYFSIMEENLKALSEALR
jgi:zinc transport system substrate-binding protein